VLAEQVDTRAMAVMAVTLLLPVVFKEATDRAEAVLEV
jgi:hypothetical protein